MYGAACLLYNTKLHLAATLAQHRLELFYVMSSQTPLSIIRSLVSALYLPRLPTAMAHNKQPNTIVAAVYYTSVWGLGLSTLVHGDDENSLLPASSGKFIGRIVEQSPDRRKTAIPQCWRSCESRPIRNAQTDSPSEIIPHTSRVEDNTIAL